MTNNNAELSGLAGPLGRAIAYIWAEAEILDRKDYAGWAALWAEDGKYIVPIEHGTDDYAGRLNYVYDDARMRRLRVERLSSGHSMSAADAAKTVRTVSRFRLVSEAGGVVEVNSSQVVVGYKRGKHTLYAADLTHRIDLAGETPRLLQKVIRLVNAEDSLSAIGFLL
ncbi:aromatic-ring-hydroxylating dioxygenase subunit beta [Pseudoduganella namucuonensis]|uniref:3-phenylpropionate/cinnamic acid dioxygenase, small subunit n=1 Tax=Pseudoduganella namucuonensis TaxID=1035707 RepID=A0A1I7LZF9_9BURK|nr:aromatic-ring-hydroxylating dioxygenase subunit beta [Pseudoduganella namucuonensis]SFV15092.1 3-phenylpropionate/cinnamic acid dioxygenase, small subunit [Pseudoduganella namucuonensis]